MRKSVNKFVKKLTNVKQRLPIIFAKIQLNFIDLVQIYTICSTGYLPYVLNKIFILVMFTKISKYTSYMYVSHKVTLDYW